MRRWHCGSAVALALATALAGCGKQAGSGGVASASASASTCTHVPPSLGLDPQEVAAVVNSKCLPPYAGPTGTLRGRVTLKGDPPPTVPVNIPEDCAPARGTYGRLFRVGQDDGLADVLVGVTRYEGYVPPRSPSVEISVRDCAYSTRTVGLTFGQHLEVKNLDGRTGYVPQLEGARSPSLRVAIPKGEAIKLYAREPGRLLLRDQMRASFLRADVFVLRYATFDVTDLNGAYRIEGIPVGEVVVGATLPQAGMLSAKERRTTIAEGDNTLDLTITFDASKHGGAIATAAPSASASPSASAGPSAP